jgi:hypothetical protein
MMLSRYRPFPRALPIGELLAGHTDVLAVATARLKDGYTIAFTSHGTTVRAWNLTTGTRSASFWPWSFERHGKEYRLPSSKSVTTCGIAVRRQHVPACAVPILGHVV